MNDTGVIIGLNRKLRELENKVDRLEKVLCPECKRKFVEIFGEKD